MNIFKFFGNILNKRKNKNKEKKIDLHNNSQSSIGLYFKSKRFQNRRNKQK